VTGAEMADFKEPARHLDGLRLSREPATEPTDFVDFTSCDETEAYFAGSRPSPER
jgi:hypothetical protein